MKKTLTLGTSIGALAALAGCNAGEKEPEAEDGHGAIEWGYAAENGPENWGELSEDFALCSTGQEQSPVNLPAVDKAATIQISGNYGTAPASVIDNGHTVQASFGKGFTLTSGENTYDLLQFHMHTPSENTIDGVAFPMVAHLVHSDEDGKLAVLAVMFEEGEANPHIQTLVDNLGGEAEINVAAMLPEDKTVYNFAGSLTTPPCSEGVNWHVLTTPVSASAEHIAELSKIMGNNARPVQPLNQRSLVEAG